MRTADGAKCLSCAVAAILTMALSVQADVAECPGNVFVEGTDVTVDGGGSAGLPFTLNDWRGNRRGSGVWNEKGCAALGRTGVGYYRIVTGTNAPVCFAVVPDPKMRLRNNDSFYAVDSAQSWISQPGDFLCRWNGGDTFTTVSDLAWLAGIGNVRDRLSAEDVSQKSGLMDYGRYFRNAELLRERGVRISGMFHDTPPHVDQDRDLENALPKDLGWLYGFTRQIAEKFGERMCDWEFWNEQDGGFSSDAVWDYASAMKAASLGFRKGNPKAVILPGGVFDGTRNAYDCGMYDNDVAKYCDAFNFHAYGIPRHMPGLIGGIRTFLKEHGLEGRAIWVTETGSDNEGVAESASVFPKFRAHSPRQELLQAETYVKLQVALQMEGVVRSHYFAFGAYSERGGSKDWGVIRRDGTVKPVYSAISTTMEMLASARLEGAVEPGDGVEAYSYVQPDGSRTLVFWTKAPDGAERKFRLKLKNGRHRLTDMCGGRETVDVSNGEVELSATQYPAYLSDCGNVGPVRPPHPCGRTGAAPAAADEDLSIVLRVELDKGDFRITDRKSVADLLHQTGRLRLVVWNFGTVEKKGRVFAKGGSLEGLPRELVVPPMGQASYDCRLVPEAGQARAKLMLRGVFGGRRTSRLAMHYRSPANCEAVDFDWTKPSNWAVSTTSSASRKDVAWDAAENALRFTYEWDDPHVDRYFYPVLAVPLPQERLKGVKMIGFEVKSVQDKVENDYRLNCVFVNFSDKTPTERAEYMAPQRQWETRTVDFRSPESGASVRSFSIGGNPIGLKCTFWLRNVRLYR